MTHATQFFVTVWLVAGGFLGFCVICMVEQASRWWEERKR